MDFNTLVQTFVSLAGVGALIAVLVNALKVAGVVHDGQAPAFITGFNLLGLVLLFLVGLLNPSIDVSHLDAVAATVAQVLTFVLALVVQIATSHATHDQLRGVPLLGKSFGDDAFNRSFGLRETKPED